MFRITISRVDRLLMYICSSGGVEALYQQGGMAGVVGLVQLWGVPVVALHHHGGRVDHDLQAGQGLVREQ